MHCTKSMFSCRPVAGLTDDNLGAAGLIWGSSSPVCCRKFTIYEAIIFFKLIVALLLIFFVFFVRSLTFSSSHLICFDCLMKILVSTPTFLSTWSNISLSVRLALMDSLVRNKSPNKEKLSAVSFFKFTRALRGSKITFDANTWLCQGGKLQAVGVFCWFRDNRILFTVTLWFKLFADLAFYH